MDLEAIVRSVDAEIAKLQHIRSLFGSANSPAATPHGRNKPSASADKRTKVKKQLSREARDKIAAAQKARWAERRKDTAVPQRQATAKKAAAKKTAAKKIAPKGIRVPAEEA